MGVLVFLLIAFAGYEAATAASACIRPDPVASEFQEYVYQSCVGVRSQTVIEPAGMGKAVLFSMDSTCA